MSPQLPPLPRLRWVEGGLFTEKLSDCKREHDELASGYDSPTLSLALHREGRTMEGQSPPAIKP